MNILFCHDGPLICDEKNRYYSIGFNDNLLSRYESVFGSAGLVTRVDRSNHAYTYMESNKLSVDRFRVIEYPNYLTVKGLFANKTQSNKMLESEISQCDALVIRLPSFLGSKCVKIARKYKKPFLIEMVGCPWDSLRNHSLPGKLLAPYMCLLTKHQVKRASDVLYVTGEFLQRRYPTNGRQIGCSDVELQSSNSSNLKIEIPSKIDNKKLIIGTIGKIDLKYKGHATVIKAMKLLKKKGYDIHYQIVGAGDKSYLENIVRKHNLVDNITFMGPMEHDAIFQWLDTIDIYIHPSLTEGMPRALIEAMSRGCPCIASDAGGMPELLEKTYIFKKGHAEQLAHILSDANKNGLYLQGARNIAFTKQFLPDVIREKRMAFYHEFQIYAMKQLPNA